VNIPKKEKWKIWAKWI